MSLLKSTTEFVCKVCGEIIRFNPEDPKTYLSKTQHEDFFGMRLTTYRVAHEVGRERHYNSIVVDDRNMFRGHRDAYSEIIGEEALPSEWYWVFGEESPAVDTLPEVNLALLVSRRDRWVVDIKCPKGLVVTELVSLLVSKIEEAERIYSTPPEHLEIVAANLSLDVWRSDNKCLFIGSNNTKLKHSLAQVAPLIIKEDDDYIPQRRVLSLVIRLLTIKPELQLPIIKRIISSDMLFTSLKTPYQDRISDIVARVSERLPIAKEILGPLLRGYTTLIELLEGQYLTRCDEIFELVDYVNRRRLIE